MQLFVLLVLFVQTFGPTLEVGHQLDVFNLITSVPSRSTVSQVWRDVTGYYRMLKLSVETGMRS
jgi:hypothetical protein